MQVEQIIDRGMAFQKPLCLLDRFESAHASLTNPGGLMRKFCSIIGVLFCVVYRLRNQCSVYDAIARKFVRDDFSGYATCLEQSLEESFRCIGVSSLLSVDVDNFAILIDGAPR